MGSTADKEKDFPAPIKGHISHKEWERTAPMPYELWTEYLKRAKHPMDFTAFQDYQYGKVPPCSITEAIKADLDTATAKGYKEYGCTLDREDLSLLDWLEHAYAETLDKAKYLKRAIKKIKDGQ